MVNNFQSKTVKGGVAIREIQDQRKFRLTVGDATLSGDLQKDPGAAEG